MCAMSSPPRRHKLPSLPVCPWAGWHTAKQSSPFLPFLTRIDVLYDVSTFSLLCPMEPPAHLRLHTQSSLQSLFVYCCFYVRLAFWPNRTSDAAPAPKIKIKKTGSKRSSSKLRTLLQIPCQTTKTTSLVSIRKQTQRPRIPFVIASGRTQSLESLKIPQ